VTGLVTSEPTTRWAVQHIVANLRERDRAEIYALRWDNDEGMVPVRPGVVIGGAFGTPKWRKVVRPITRWARGFIIPSLQNANYHRIEAYVLAENTDSRRWIERFGGEVEALLKSFGRSREDFLLYVLDLTQGRTNDVLFQRPKGSKRTQDGNRLSS
jgi:hypothetical protein